MKLRPIFIILFLIQSSFLLGCAQIQTKPVTAVADACESIEAPELYRSWGLKTASVAVGQYGFTSKGIEALENNLRVLENKPNLKIQVEGHVEISPNKGVEESIRDGQKIAEAAQEYLLRKGVKPERISVVSYGSEKLFDRTCPECAYPNRRVSFVPDSGYISSDENRKIQGLSTILLPT